MGLDFIVDKETCIKCGLCVEDCPVNIISLNPYPLIVAKREKDCLECQHCLAVCPTGSISILGKDPSQSVSSLGGLPTYESMKRLVKTRRSIRKYKQESLPKEVLDDLLATTAYAPTGHNDNSVLFSVIDNIETMHQLRDLTYDAIRTVKENGELEEKFEFIANFERMWHLRKTDIMFRNAPHMIIASAPKTVASPLQDGLIALSYFELLANSQGIGTLWNGIIKWVINDIAPSLRTLIGIPDNHVIGYVLLFGKPAIKYSRSIQTDGLHVNRIQI